MILLSAICRCLQPDTATVLTSSNGNSIQFDFVCACVFKQTSDPFALLFTPLITRTYQFFLDELVIFLFLPRYHIQLDGIPSFSLFCVSLQLWESLEGIYIYICERTTGTRSRLSAACYSSSSIFLGLDRVFLCPSLPHPLNTYMLSSIHPWVLYARTTSYSGLPSGIRGNLCVYTYQQDSSCMRYIPSRQCHIYRKRQFIRGAGPTALPGQAR